MAGRKLLVYVRTVEAAIVGFMSEEDIRRVEIATLGTGARAKEGGGQKFFSLSPAPPPLRRVAFGLPYLFFELFYICMPVVRTDGRTFGHVINKISRMGGLPHFFGYKATLKRALGALLKD